MVSQRVKVETSELRRVVNNLKNNEMTLDDISDKIGARIDSYLYYDHTMSQETFENLTSLQEGQIEHTIVDSTIGGSRNKNEIKELRKSPVTAELIGYILGDGHLQKHFKKTEGRYEGSYYLEISLHEEQSEIISRAQELIYRTTGEYSKKYSGQGKTARIVLHSKDFVEKLENLGLETGNKKKNQVSVPLWIKENRDFSKACIRGLIDTDGSIYEDRRRSTEYIRIQFSNHSENLLDDYREMCEELGFSVRKGGEYKLQISRPCVKQFLQTIEPIKASPYV